MNSPPEHPNPDASPSDSPPSRLIANLELVEAALDEAYNCVEARMEEVQRREHDLEQRSRSAAVREAKTRLQRRRIAEELRAKKAELATCSPAGARGGEELIALQRANDELQRELRLQRDLADEAMREAAAMRERAIESQPDGDMIGQLRDELQRLMKERDEAREALRTFESAMSSQTSGQDGMIAEDVERLEEENRSLLAELNDLRSELERAKNGDVSEPEEESFNGFDWETQKNLLLDNLDEAMTNRLHTEVQALERAAEVATTGFVADESEVRDLRDQINMLVAALASQSDENVERFDYVAALQEERNKLESLQQQWHDKLRESELEISVERAKLARERVKLEEEMREMEAAKSRQPTEPETTEPASRNRWLARLGLSDDT